ncbi:MAG: Cell division protein FtsL [Candidatus Aminicenantes bacterium]|jgi:cell division protein FtsL|nr:Cell division protein FtsL [Candidatus Aminicenantes bacterium]
MVRRKGALKGIALGAAFFAAAAGILTFYVWYQTESVKLGLDIANCEDRIRDLEKEIEALKLRKAALLDPGRVERIARDSLGLVDPDDAAIVYERTGSIR